MLPLIQKKYSYCDGVVSIAVGEMWSLVGFLVLATAPPPSAMPLDVEITKVILR